MLKEITRRYKTKKIIVNLFSLIGFFFLFLGLWRTYMIYTDKVSAEDLKKWIININTNYICSLIWFWNSHFHSIKKDRYGSFLGKINFLYSSTFESFMTKEHLLADDFKELKIKNSDTNKFLFYIKFQIHQITSELNSDMLEVLNDIMDNKLHIQDVKFKYTFLKNEFDSFNKIKPIYSVDMIGTVDYDNFNTFTEQVSILDTNETSEFKDTLMKYFNIKEILKVDAELLPPIESLERGFMI